MLTDITLLPVYNKLYKLNLSESEIEKINIHLQNLHDTKFVYNFLSAKTIIRLNSYHGYYRGNGKIELITENKAKSDLSKKLLENLPCYSIANKFFNVFFKNIKITEFTKDDIKFIPNAVELLEKKLYVFESIDKLKNLIKKKLTNKIFSEEFLGSHSFDDLDSVDFISWVFDIKLPQYNAIGKLRNKLSNVGQIVDVTEDNNTRIAICYKIDNRSYYNHWDRFYLVAKPELPCYNFLDIGRQFYIKSPSSSKQHWLSDQFPKLFLLNEEVKPPNDERIFEDILNRHPSEETFLVDSMEIESVIRRFQRKDLLNKNKLLQKEFLKKKFLDRLKILNDKDKKISINGIEMKKHSIKYEGQLLECSSIDVVDLTGRYAYYRNNLDDLNFDTLSGDFFERITNSFAYMSTSSNESTGKIGDVKFNLKNKIITLPNGNHTRLIYLNNYKIKKNEIGKILKRGLCFNNQKLFDEFIKQVSRCSLQTHKYLDEGVLLEVYDDYKDSRINFKLPLIRKRNKNYIVIDDKEYQISNTEKIIKLTSARSMYEVINTLLNPDIVKINGPDDIVYIISHGEELYKKTKDKNKKLIENTEKLFNLEIITITFNGTHLRGYIIEGKLKKYFLDIGKTDKESIFDRLRVYTYPNMNYICMIDKTIVQTGPTNLINRIYALHNDSLIAKDITTLNQKT